MTILKFFKAYPRILNLPKPDLDIFSYSFSFSLRLSCSLHLLLYTGLLFAEPVFRISQMYRGKVGYVSVALISAVAKDILVGGKNEEKAKMKNRECVSRERGKPITQVGNVMIIHYFMRLSLSSLVLCTKATLLNCRDQQNHIGVSYSYL